MPELTPVQKYLLETELMVQSKLAKICSELNASNIEQCLEKIEKMLPVLKLLQDAKYEFTHATVNVRERIDSKGHRHREVRLFPPAKLYDQLKDKQYVKIIILLDR